MVKEMFLPFADAQIDLGREYLRGENVLFNKAFPADKLHGIGVRGCVWIVL